MLYLCSIYAPSTPHLCPIHAPSRSPSIPHPFPVYALSVPRLCLAIRQSKKMLPKFLKSLGLTILRGWHGLHWRILFRLLLEASDAMPAFRNILFSVAGGLHHLGCDLAGY